MQTYKNTHTHPKVEVCQVALISILGGQQVARVGVSVEKAVFQKLPKGALDTDIDKVNHVQSSFGHCLLISELDTICGEVALRDTGC